MNMEWFWIKNTHKKNDAMLTFAFWAFMLVCVKVLLAGNEFTFWGQKWVITPIDAATIGTLLTPTLSAYVARRNGFFASDAKTVAKAEGVVEE